MAKLEIRQNLIAEDGSYLNKKDVDWTDVWYIKYNSFCFIVDSQGHPIELGKIDVVPHDWFTMEELGNVNIDNYPHLVKSILDVVEALHQNDPWGEFIHPAVRTFDLLWGYYSNFIDNPVELGRQLEVPLEYLDSFVESYSDLDVHWVKDYK